VIPNAELKGIKSLEIPETTFSNASLPVGQSSMIQDKRE
jgi:hypothetical protein